MSKKSMTSQTCKKTIFGQKCRKMKESWFLVKNIEKLDLWSKSGKMSKMLIFGVTNVENVDFWSKLSKSRFLIKKMLKMSFFGQNFRKKWFLVKNVEKSRKRRFVIENIEFVQNVDNDDFSSKMSNNEEQLDFWSNISKKSIYGKKMYKTSIFGQKWLNSRFFAKHVENDDFWSKISKDVEEVDFWSKLKYVSKYIASSKFFWWCLTLFGPRSWD